MTAKIQIFESNSQLSNGRICKRHSCLWPQRYKFLKAIHNLRLITSPLPRVVYDRKDTNFWKQFTTSSAIAEILLLLFMTAKIQIFESNSQPHSGMDYRTSGCLWPQRYKFLKAIHNRIIAFDVSCELFMTAKIQIFESNSQHDPPLTAIRLSCLWPQRYKFLKAIHNRHAEYIRLKLLFMTAKIQIFESNSQLQKWNHWKAKRPILHGYIFGFCDIFFCNI